MSSLGAPDACRLQRRLVNLKPEIISQGDRELIVNMTILETWDETLASYLRRARQANSFDN